MTLETAALRHRPPPPPPRVQGVYAGAAARRVFWTRQHGTRVIRFFSGKTRALPTATDYTILLYDGSGLSPTITRNRRGYFRLENHFCFSRVVFLGNFQKIFLLVFLSRHFLRRNSIGTHAYRTLSCSCSPCSGPGLH